MPLLVPFSSKFHHPLSHLLHLRLQHRICLGPELRELPEVLQRPFGIASLVVQLSQPPERRGTLEPVLARTAHLPGCQKAFVVDCGGIGSAGLVEPVGQLEQVAGRARVV